MRASSPSSEISITPWVSVTLRNPLPQVDPGPDTERNSRCIPVAQRTSKEWAFDDSGAVDDRNARTTCPNTNPSGAVRSTRPDGSRGTAGFALQQTFRRWSALPIIFDNNL
jgi:hypothetical protein